jgi:hypothetical protein
VSAVRSSFIVFSESELTGRRQGFSTLSTRHVESGGHLFLEYLGVTSHAPENPEVRKLPSADNSS